MVKQIALSMEIIGETFSQSSCFELLYEKSSGRLLFWPRALNLRQNLKTRRVPKAGVFLNSKSDQEILWETCYKNM